MMLRSARFGPPSGNTALYSPRGGQQHQSHAAMQQQQQTLKSKQSKLSPRNPKLSGIPSNSPSTSSTIRERRAAEMIAYANGVFHGLVIGAGERSGLGIYAWDSGEVYYGEWKKDAIDGEGMLFFPQGGFVHGFFLKGKLNGAAFLKFGNGNVYEGFFRNGYLEGNCYMYSTPSNTWKLFNYKHGQPYGSLISSGSGLPPSYVFGYITSTSEIARRHAHGSRTPFECVSFPDGGQYLGVIRKGMPSGLGIFRYGDGKYDVGVYREGKLHGMGRMHMGNGDVYDGQLVRGNFEGRGMFFEAASAEWVCGDFKSNTCVNVIRRGVDGTFPSQIVRKLRIEAHMKADAYVNRNTPIELFVIPSSEFDDQVQQAGSELYDNRTGEDFNSESASNVQEFNVELSESQQFQQARLSTEQRESQQHQFYLDLSLSQQNNNNSRGKQVPAGKEEVVVIAGENSREEKQDKQEGEDSNEGGIYTNSQMSNQTNNRNSNSNNNSGLLHQSSQQENSGFRSSNFKHTRQITLGVENPSDDHQSDWYVGDSDRMITASVESEDLDRKKRSKYKKQNDDDYERVPHEIPENVEHASDAQQQVKQLPAFDSSGKITFPASMMRKYSPNNNNNLTKKSPSRSITSNTSNKSTKNKALLNMPQQQKVVVDEQLEQLRIQNNQNQTFENILKSERGKRRWESDIQSQQLNNGLNSNNSGSKQKQTSGNDHAGTGVNQHLQSRSCDMPAASTDVGQKTGMSIPLGKLELAQYFVEPFKLKPGARGSEQNSRDSSKLEAGKFTGSASNSVSNTAQKQRGLNYGITTHPTTGAVAGVLTADHSPDRSHNGVHDYDTNFDSKSADDVIGIGAASASGAKSKRNPLTYHSESNNENTSSSMNHHNHRSSSPTINLKRTNNNNNNNLQRQGSLIDIESIRSEIASFEQIASQVMPERQRRTNTGRSTKRGGTNNNGGAGDLSQDASVNSRTPNSITPTHFSRTAGDQFFTGAGGSIPETNHLENIIEGAVEDLQLKNNEDVLQSIKQIKLEMQSKLHSLESKQNSLPSPTAVFNSASLKHVLNRVSSLHIPRDNNLNTLKDDSLESSPQHMAEISTFPEREVPELCQIQLKKQTSERASNVIASNQSLQKQMSYYTEEEVNSIAERIERNLTAGGTDASCFNNFRDICSDLLGQNEANTLRSRRDTSNTPNTATNDNTLPRGVIPQSQQNTHITSGSNINNNNNNNNSIPKHRNEINSEDSDDTNPVQTEQQKQQQQSNKALEASAKEYNYPVQFQPGSTRNKQTTSTEATNMTSDLARNGRDEQHLSSQQLFMDQIHPNSTNMSLIPVLTESDSHDTQQQQSSMQLPIGQQYLQSFQSQQQQQQQQQQLPELVSPSLQDSSQTSSLVISSNLAQNNNGTRNEFDFLKEQQRNLLEKQQQCLQRLEAQEVLLNHIDERTRTHSVASQKSAQLTPVPSPQRSPARGTAIGYAQTKQASPTQQYTQQPLLYHQHPVKSSGSIRDEIREEEREEEEIVIENEENLTELSTFTAFEQQQLLQLQQRNQQQQQQRELQAIRSPSEVFESSNNENQIIHDVVDEQPAESFEEEEVEVEETRKKSRNNNSNNSSSKNKVRLDENTLRQETTNASQQQVLPTSNTTASESRNLSDYYFMASTNPTHSQQQLQPIPSYQPIMVNNSRYNLNNSNLNEQNRILFNEIDTIVSKIRSEVANTSSQPITSSSPPPQRNQSPSIQPTSYNNYDATIPSHPSYIQTPTPAQIANKQYIPPHPRQSSNQSAGSLAVMIDSPQRDGKETQQQQTVGVYVRGVPHGLPPKQQQQQQQRNASAGRSEQDSNGITDRNLFASFGESTPLVPRPAAAAASAIIIKTDSTPPSQLLQLKQSLPHQHQYSPIERLAYHHRIHDPNQQQLQQQQPIQVIDRQSPYLVASMIPTHQQQLIPTTSAAVAALPITTDRMVSAHQTMPVTLIRNAQNTSNSSRFSDKSPNSPKLNNMYSSNCHTIQVVPSSNTTQTTGLMNQSQQIVRVASADQHGVGRTSSVAQQNPTVVYHRMVQNLTKRVTVTHSAHVVKEVRYPAGRSLSLTDVPNNTSSAMRVNTTTATANPYQTTPLQLQQEYFNLNNIIGTSKQGGQPFLHSASMQLNLSHRSNSRKDSGSSLASLVSPRGMPIQLQQQQQQNMVVHLSRSCDNSRIAMVAPSYNPNIHLNNSCSSSPSSRILTSIQPMSFVQSPQHIVQSISPRLNGSTTTPIIFSNTPHAAGLSQLPSTRVPVTSGRVGLNSVSASAAPFSKVVIQQQHGNYIQKVPPQQLMQLQQQQFHMQQQQQTSPILSPLAPPSPSNLNTESGRNFQLNDAKQTMGFERGDAIDERDENMCNIF